VVSPRLLTSHRLVAALAATGCLALLSGCMFGSGSDKDSGESHRSDSCGLLSSSSLKELTGGTPVKTGGEMASHQLRANGGLHCVIFDAATGKTILQIGVVDTSDHTSAATLRRRVVEEGKQIPHCKTRAALPHNGYLCVQAGQAIAAAAMPKRSVSFFATREASTRLTEDNAAKLLDEVNSRVDRYDASQS
jgi:hypothetical protein